MEQRTPERADQHHSQHRHEYRQLCDAAFDLARSAAVCALFDSFMAANKKATNVIAALVISVSVIVLYATLHGFGPRVDTTAHKALGQMVAEEALKARGPAGRITVLARDTSTQENPYADAELKTLQYALKKARGVMTTTRLLKLNPIRLIAVAPGDFFDVLKKASEEDVVVSLIGPPVLSDQEAAKLGERHAKIVAV